MIKKVYTIRTVTRVSHYTRILSSLLIVDIPARGFGAFNEDLDRSGG